MSNVTPSRLPLSHQGRGDRQMMLIMTDTQRWDMLGCYGNPGIHTPNPMKNTGRLAKIREFIRKGV